MSLSYEFDAYPDDGKTLQIADGLQWLRMPLPMSLNHINLWLLRDGAGWAIVDTGMGTSKTLELWKAVFGDAMGGDPASRVIVTHMHPDHVGCAGFLTDHFDVDLCMSRDEYMLCRILAADTGRSAPEEGVEFYGSAGFTQEQIHAYKSFFGSYGKFIKPLPEAYTRISDGDQLSIGDRSWQVVSGGGHSPEHASLLDRENNILISGDQILPTISSNVSVWPTEPHANPLQDWFDSLHKMRATIPEDVLVLPAHGKPFRGAYIRIDALVKEHEDNLAALQTYCREAKRAVDVFPALFKARISDTNLIMATGEAVAHLNFLIEAGQMRAERRDDAIWYQTN